MLEFMIRKLKQIKCQLNNHKKYSTFYNKVAKRSIRNDVILNMLDHYYLDPDQIYYVFEMEQFNSTLSEIEKHNDQNKQFIFNAKKQITEYFNNSLRIFYKNTNQYYQSTKECYENFYICMTHDKQLKVKFNLIDHNWIIPSDIKKINNQMKQKAKLKKKLDHTEN
ncbi:hypothetical protein ABPG72_015949 [Tetrahymena utriculariae]